MITAGLGRYGPFVLHDGKYANLESMEEVFSVGINRAVAVIAEKAAGGGKGRFQRAGPTVLKDLGVHPDEGGPIQILSGRYGPYIAHNKVYANVPRNKEPEAVSVEEAIALLAERIAKGGGKKSKAKSAKKPAAAAAAEKKPAKKAPGKPTSAPAKKAPAEKGPAKRPQRRRPLPKARRKAQHPAVATPQSRDQPKDDPACRKSRSAATRLIGPVGRARRARPRAAKRRRAECRRASNCSTISATTTEKVGKREIARAFGLKGEDRVALKSMLADLAADGAIVGNRKALKAKGKLPPVGVLEIVERDNEGELVAIPTVWDVEEGEKPKILILKARRALGPDGDGALGIGDRVLARINRLEGTDVFGYAHEAEPIKRLPRERSRLMGIFRKAARGGGGTIDPIDRKALKEWPVHAGNEGDAVDGDLVRFDIVRRHREGVPQARVVEALGNPQDQRRISLVAIHAHGLPDTFPDAVLAEAEDLPAIDMRGRVDLRALPLVTIDPVDARDHDDAVLAEPDADPGNDGGYIVTVAIADVAHYVRPGSQARSRSAPARQLGLFPRPRRADAAGTHFQRSVLAARRRGARVHGGAHGVRPPRRQAPAHVYSRHHEIGGAALSYQEAQAAIDGRPSDRAVADAGDGAQAAVGSLCGALRRA